MINFGIVGTSWITESFLKGAMMNKDFKLAAVYSRSDEKAKEFAKKYNAEYTFTSIEEMAKSPYIDAVYIASPNSFHCPQSLVFLNNKKHVICEKPMASNPREISEMIDAAKKNNVALMEALKPNFTPNFQLIKDNLYKIGTIRRYFTSFCQYSSKYDRYKDGIILNAFRPEFSNGALMDIGVYCLNIMVQLFGEPKSIKADAYMLKSGIDGEGSIIAEYDNMLGTAIFSKISNSYVPSEIQGEKGSILIDHISQINRVWIRYNDGTEEDLTPVKPSFIPHAEQGADSDNNMRYEASHFIDMIKKGEIESPVNTFEKSMAISRIMEEARNQIGLKFPADNI